MAKNKAPAKLLTACPFDYDMFKLIKDKPHLIGWMVGKTKLTDIHSDWIKYIWTSKKSASLMAHRGSYKSTAITQVGSLWYLLFNPEARIAIVRKTFTDAADTINTIAKFFEIPEVREMFRYAHGEYPEFKTRKEGILTLSFKKTATPEGSINGFGLSSAFTGRHFDIIICDDISTLDDRLYKSKREYTKMIWMELSTNIIDRGKPCNYIGTPWHKDGVESIIPPPITFSIDECNLMSPEEVEFARSQTTASLFAANYLLKFMSDDDAPFKNPVMGEWKTSGIEGIYAHVDAAYGGSDFTALTIMARRNDGKIQAYGRLYKESIVDCLDWIVDTCERMKVRKIYCEKQSDRGWTGSMLRKKGMIVNEYDENTKKDHKIATYVGEVWPLLIFSEDTDPQYLSQVEDWTPETKNHDDSCFVAGTRIATPMGDIAIENLRAGDKVITPFGISRVLASGCTGIKPTICRGGLTGTPNHKIFCGDSFSPLSLANMESFDIFSLGGLIEWGLLTECFSMETGTLDRNRKSIISVNVPRTQGEGGLSSCIRLFGNFITEKKFQKAITFITLILIRIITIFLIWLHYRLGNIFNSILRTMPKILSMWRNRKKIWTESEQRLPNGTGVRRGWNGTENTPRTQLEKNSIMQKLVPFAGRNLMLPALLRSIAAKVVIENPWRSQKHHENAPIAGKNSFQSSTRRNTVLLDAKAPFDTTENVRNVYNLTTSDGVYYAEGVLVSNCDSLSCLIRAKFSKKGATIERWRM